MEYALFDLYHVFVEVLFGNFFFAILGILVIFAIFCALLRMSSLLSISILMLFFLVMMIGFYGSIFAILIFTLSASYFMYSIARWIMGYLN